METLLLEYKDTPLFANIKTEINFKKKASITLFIPLFFHRKRVLYFECLL